MKTFYNIYFATYYNIKPQQSNLRQLNVLLTTHLSSCTECNDENVLVVFKDCKYFVSSVHYDKSLIFVQRVFPNLTCSSILTTAMN